MYTIKFDKQSVHTLNNLDLKNIKVDANGLLIDFLDIKNWFKLSKIIYEKNLSDLVDSEIVYYDTIEKSFAEMIYSKFNEYSKFKTIKQIFLADIMSDWISKQNIRKAIETLHFVEPFEERFNKPAFLFNEDETTEVILGLYEDRKFFSLRFKLKVLKDYQNFYRKELDLSNKTNFWEKYYTLNRLQELLNEDIKNINITKKMLLDLFSNMMNPQQSIVPLLVFEGLTFSKKYDPDEIRGLLKTNIEPHSIFVPAVTDKVDSHGFRIKIDRKIEIDDEVYQALLKTMNTKDMFFIGRYGYLTEELKNTPFLLTTVEKRKQRSDGNEWISNDGLNSRLLVCKENMEVRHSEIADFRTTYIANCGKAHYIKKYMSEGQKETEAIINTLKRFGEWNSCGDLSKEKMNATNKIRISRLRTSYPLYDNEYNDLKSVFSENGRDSETPDEFFISRKFNILEEA